MDCIREAASSIPNGIPSRRRQISTTAVGCIAQRDRRRDGPGALDEQRDAADSLRRSRGGTGQSCSSTTRRPSRLVARIFTVVGTREYRFDQVSGGIEDVLAVVEHQQSRTILQRRGDAGGHAHSRLLNDSEYSGDGLGHRGGIADRGQLDHEDAVGEPMGRPGGHFQRQAGLAHAADAGQRDEAMSLQRRLQLGDFRVASDEARRRTGADCPASNPASSGQGNRCRDPAPEPGTWQQVSRCHVTGASPGQ